MDLGDIRTAKLDNQSQPCENLGCDDPFGSRPVKSNGRDTQLSRKLEQLMDAAIWRGDGKTIGWDGLQTDYFSPEVAENSVIDRRQIVTGGAGRPIGQYAGVFSFD